jgi:hypothetical protein
MCAAPSGNQFWKLRSKHGRDAIFTDPTVLWEEASKYFNWVDAHPWYKVEQSKKPYQDKTGNWITVTKVPTARPYTIQGLCRYLSCNSKWFNEFEDSIARRLADKDDEAAKDFSEILHTLREIIYQQKFEGAAVGAFNWAIIARDLSLKEKSEVTGEGGTPLNPPAVVNIHPVASSAPILEEEKDEIDES